jgi:acyl carrier protein
VGGAPSPGPIPVGRPIPGAVVALLDPDGEPVGPGCIGEIHIGGIGVARGYRQRSADTADRFQRRRWDGQEMVMYRTGDLGRWRADGQLEFHGRNDEQLKVRGYRIEPAEVEAALMAHAAVAACAVVVQTAEDRARLVAWLVAAAGHDRPAAAELRRHLQPRLPPHMVPSAFEWIEGLPVTVSGKVDRQALSARPTAAAQEPAVSLPADGVSARLAALWQDLLRRPHVALDDNFFDLGGDSLMALQLSARIRETTGVELGLQALLECQTLRALSERVELAQLARGAGQPDAAEDQAREEGFV